MSEMIERVARAIFKAHNASYDSWEDAGGDVPHSTTRTNYFKEARAAIEAMREPTEAMMYAAFKLEHPVHDDVWEVMIDEALK